MVVFLSIPPKCVCFVWTSFFILCPTSFAYVTQIFIIIYLFLRHGQPTHISCDIINNSQTLLLILHFCAYTKPKIKQFNSLAKFQIINTDIFEVTKKTGSSNIGKKWSS